MGWSRGIFVIILHMQFSVKSNIWKMQVLNFINWFLVIIPTLVIFYQAHGLSMKQVMIIQAVFSISLVLIEIPSGYFADRFGRKILFTSFIFLIPISYIFLGASKAPWVLIFIFVFNIVRGIKGPLIDAYINGLIPSYMRATVLSVHQFAGRLMFAVISPFLGWAADLYSLNYALLLSAGVFFLAGFVALIFMGLLTDRIRY